MGLQQSCLHNPVPSRAEKEERKQKRAADGAAAAAQHASSSIPVSAKQQADRLQRHHKKGALLKAAGPEGSEAVMLVLLDRPGTVEASEHMHPGFPPLLLAAEKGYIHAVRKLLQRPRTDPNAANAQGETALIAASFFGYAEIVEELLRAGARPGQVNSEGISALHGATMFGYLHVVRLLLQAGAGECVNVHDHYGSTPLHLASISNNHAVLSELLQYRDIDLNTKNGEGFTPLEYARQAGDAEAAALIERRAKDDARSRWLVS